MSYAERIRSTHKRAVDDKKRDPAVAFEAGLLTALGIAVEADSEIERLRGLLEDAAYIEMKAKYNAGQLSWANMIAEREARAR